MKAPRKPDFSQVFVWTRQQPEPFSSLMRANARRHRKLKGGGPFGSTIPPIPTPFFSGFRLIDSPLNVALHLDVIGTVLSEKMKELSIPGFIPFILQK